MSYQKPWELPALSDAELYGISDAQQDRDEPCSSGDYVDDDKSDRKATIDDHHECLNGVVPPWKDFVRSLVDSNARRSSWYQQTWAHWRDRTISREQDSVVADDLAPESPCSGLIDLLEDLGDAVTIEEHEDSVTQAKVIKVIIPHSALVDARRPVSHPKWTPPDEMHCRLDSPPSKPPVGDPDESPVPGVFYVFDDKPSVGDGDPD